MKCGSCSYQFCWVCMGDWVKFHSDHWTCNKFEEVKTKDKYLNQEKTRTNAKHELERYMFFYERYVSHLKSEQAADKHMTEINSKVLLLHKLKHYPDGELTFLVDACRQVIKCRAVLKWSYAYGYYTIPNKNKIQLNQFEFQQTDLEHFCEKMHMMVEQPLDPYLDPAQVDRSPFYKFKGTLISIMEATRKYYESLVACIN